MRTAARTSGMIGSAAPWSRAVLFFCLAGAVAGWDLYSKSVVFRDLGPAGVSEWQQQWFSGNVQFELRTNFNYGALWGVGQGYAWLFASLSVLAIVGILYWLFLAGGARSLWLTIALGFIMGGTLGNLYDRLGLHGFRHSNGEAVYAVRDFLYFRFFQSFDWAIFNFADSFLVTGAIMLVLHTYQPENAPASVESPATSAGKTEAAA